MSRNAKLTLADIADVRAYERERDTFRAEVIALKARRRVHIGTVVSLVFENRETIRFQIQEMARVEKLVTDEAIQGELDTYNPLIPEPGILSATLFIECTSDDQMRHWLPRLVGIERAIELRIGSGANAVAVRCEPDAAHDAQLTREEITAAVHYVRFRVGTEHAAALRSGPASLAVVHPEYLEVTELLPSTCAELADDVAG
jgi:hypothetical protein